MQRRSVFLGAGLLALLGITYWSVQRPKERGIERLRFDHVARSAIDRIDISGAHRAALRLDNGVWRLSNGRAADARAVAQALDAIAEFESTDFLTDDESDFEDYKVIGAKSSDVRLEAKGRSVLSMTLSDDGGMAQECNVRYRQRVFRGTMALSMPLLRDESAWLDRHLFDVDEQQVEAIDVSLAGQAPYTLSRTVGENSTDWSLSPTAQTTGYRFDAAAAGTLMNVLMNTQVHEYIDLDPGEASTGLGEDQGDAITLRQHAAPGAEPVIARLRLGRAREGGDVFARVEGAGNSGGLFVLAATQVESLRRAPGEYRALNVMAQLDFDRVVEAGIERPGEKPLRFAREPNSAWHIVAGKPHAGYVLDPIKLNQRLRKITLARAIGIAEPKQGAMAPANGRAWLKTSDGHIHALRFGAPVRVGKGSTHIASYWARGTADALTYKISRPLREDILAKAADLAKATPTAKSPAPSPMGSGLDQLPPEVRADVERQLAQQKQAG